MSIMNIMSMMKLINRVRPVSQAHMTQKKYVIKVICSATSVKTCATLLLGLLWVLYAAPLPAQTFSEWFKQKKTQKKYLLAQIAALQGYTHWIEKGYQIAANGLDVVSAFKQGDFSQHSRYFSSREIVSSEVKNYRRVPAILEMEDAMSKISSQLKARAGSELATMLNSAEMTALKRIGDGAAAEANKELETLVMLVKDRALNMTVDERIAAINRLYKKVRKRLTTTMTFHRRLQALVRSRKKQAAAAAAADMSLLRRLYGE